MSYNGGRNETWAFTEIDHGACLGLTAAGTHWRRPDDHLGVAVVANGISAAHRAYLAAGGYGFIIGDGALRYAPACIGEAYYSIAFPRYHSSLTPDYQLVINSAYNCRGPVHVAAVLLHVQF